MRRRDFLGTLLAFTASVRPCIVRAQNKPMPVIGWLATASPERSAPLVAAFLQGLRETGYVDKQNVLIEYRWAGGRYDRLPALAAEIVAGKVDVFVAGGGTPSALAAKRATSEIPIVFVTDDAVARGLVVGLARPGGNLTGMNVLSSELMPKRLELLTELVPQARVVALLVNPGSPLTEGLIREAQEGARVKAVNLQLLYADTEAEIEAAFTSLVRLQAGALFVGPDPFFIGQRKNLIAMASNHAVPAIYPWSIFATDGGLISYGPSLTDALRRVGVYAGRILNGAKPADLPVEQPTRFELVINLNTAKALGITVPPSLLARADEVIE